MEEKMMNKGNFSFVDTPGVLTIKIGGFFSKEDGEAYIREYNSQLRKINPKTKSLVLDCRELKVTTQDLLPMLQGCIVKYCSDEFKNVKAIINKNQPVLSMQIKKLVRNANVDNFDIELVA